MYLKLYCQKVDSTRNGKLRRLYIYPGDLFSDSNLETSRTGPKSGLIILLTKKYLNLDTSGLRKQMAFHDAMTT